MSKPLVATTLLFASFFANATEVHDYSLETHLGYGHSSETDSSMQEEIRLAPGFDVRFSPQSHIVLQGRIRLDFADELGPGEASTQTYSSLSRPLVIQDLGTAELRDAYFQHTLQNGVFRIGKQQIVWGRLDGIKIVDVLNPQDFREFILEEFGESRISLWSAYLDVTLGKWRTEVAVIPDNTGHAIPARGAWFELTAPRYRYGAAPADPEPQVITDRESIDASTSAFAVRLSRALGVGEFGLVAYSGLDHEPLGRPVVGSNVPTVERFYERRNLVGLHAETTLGPVVLRAEAAYQPDRKFNLRTETALTTTELDQLTVGIGLDVEGPWGLFINMQHVRDEVRNAPAALVRPDLDRYTTVFLRRSFSYDVVTLTGRYYRSHKLGDDMLTVALEFALGDATELRLAADMFDGDASGVFGQFADRDRITLWFTHTF